MEPTEFRYETREEYEAELVKLVKTKGRAGSKQKEYDDLLEEYLRFREKHG